MNEPTTEGERRWPPDGFLKLKPAVDGPDRFACVCTATCKPDCTGECGCEACTLAWLVYQDEQAMWSEGGELLNGVDLGPGWQRIADPRQLHLRFANRARRDVASHQSAGDSNMHVQNEKMHRDSSSSVPPVLDTHHDWAPVPLEWQRSLPEVEEKGHPPASLPKGDEDDER